MALVTLFKDPSDGFPCVQVIGLMVVVVAFDVEDEDDEMARFDRLEFTHVAPVDVNGCGCLIGADDEMERVELVEGFFRAA